MVKKKKKFDITGYLMILPAYSIYLLFVLIPLIIGLFYSFTSYNFNEIRFIGLTNYKALISDEIFIKSVINTLVYALGTVVPSLIIGIILAVMVNKKIFASKMFRTFMYLPNVCSMVAVSMIWLWVYDPTLGFLNQILLSVGAKPVQWLFNKNTAMISVIVIGIWRTVGYNMVINLSGLQGIPDSLYESARVDGASEVRQFLSITIPMLRPTIFFLVVTGCINSFLVFEQVNIMTSGGPLNSTTTIVHQIYKSAFLDLRMGYGSAMAVVLLLLTIMITLLNFKYGNQGSDLDLS